MPQTTSELRREGIELPWSSPTRAGRYRSFAKLLYRVDPGALTGFGFHGQLMKPGAWVFPWELWPTEEHPAQPVLLEYVAQNGRTREEQKAGSLYVLWRLDCEEGKPDVDLIKTGKWRELGRATGQSTEWVAFLGPIALRALNPPRKPMGKAAADVGEIVRRIAQYLDEELGRLEGVQHDEVLDAVHNELAVRICRAG